MRLLRLHYPSLSLENKSVKWALLLALLYTFIAPLFNIKLNGYIAPLLAPLYRWSRLQCLWLACGLGLFADLFSAPFPLGLHATVFVAVQWLLLYCKDYLFADTPTTLPLLAFLAGFTMTLLTAIFLHLSGHHALHLSWSFILYDGFILSWGDAFLAVAFLSFSAIAEWVILSDRQ